MNRELSYKAFEEARQYIPGGVNSPVRALRAVGESPLFVDHAKGVTFTDIDGNEYIDFCLSWGVFIAGLPIQWFRKRYRKLYSTAQAMASPRSWKHSLPGRFQN